MLKNVTDLAAPDYSKGLNTVTNILAVGKNQTPNIMNVSVNFDGGLQKRMGSVTNNGVVISQSGGASFTVNTNLTLNTGLVAFWQLNEPSGTRFASFGTANLTDNNSVLSASGIRGQAASFVATQSQSLSYPSIAQFSPGGPSFSISTWFFLAATSKTLQQTIISKRDGILAFGVDSQTVLMLHLNSSNFADSSPSNHVVTTTAQTVNSGNVVIDNGIAKFGIASALFNGFNYLQADDSTDWKPGTQDFTFDGQFRFTSTASMTLFSTNFNSGFQFDFANLGGGTGAVRGFINSGIVTLSAPWFPSLNTWYHIAFNRSSGTLSFFVDGSSIGSTANAANITGDTKPLNIGRSAQNNDQLFVGYMDELRITRGRPRYTASNFVPPTMAYHSASNPTMMEYWLYVDTDNQITFDASSTGTGTEVTVKATSFGTVSTSTWYNVVVWHDSAQAQLGISVNTTTNQTVFATATSALFQGSAPFVLGAISNGADALYTGRIDDTGFWSKLLTTSERTNLYNQGSGNTFSLGFNQNPWASFDFGAQANRWLTVAAGTGIFASNNLGRTFATVASDRSATYQYFERSKNVLIATSELYDTPLAWSGSAGSSFITMNSNAPLAKYTANFQGFCILLNTATRKRGFFYQDENTQLTGTWANSFDLPSSADDEITAAFILRRYLYISTRYSLFRVSYVGGNPDWSFQLIKSFGFVPRTVSKLTLGQVGEVAIGEDFDRRIRVFDGADDKIISTDVEDDNGMCDFATSKVSYAGSGLLPHFAVVDPTAYVYKLAVGIGTNSTDVTHWLNFDARTSAFFPYSNMPFSTMTVAESGFQRYLMAFDKSGFCHMMDSGNLDAGVTPIDEVFDSPFLFDKSPSQVSKGHKIDLFFVPHSSGTIHFYDRTNFSTVFDHKHKFQITGTTNEILTKVSVDTPTSYNTYQFRLSSSASTAEGWELIRNDNFIFGLGIGGFQR